MTDPRVHDSVPIIVFESTGSTNDDARAYARTHPEERAALIVANSQTSGRGRLGRSFLSPASRGIYMSILLIRPELAPADAPLITAYAATVVRQAISDVCSLDTRIKWVNDITVSDKKLSGILTEGALLPDGSYEYCTVGIGINVSGCVFPPELKDIATSLECEGAAVGREALIARITELFFKKLNTVGTLPVAEEYRQHSSVIGRRVTVIKPDTRYGAEVTGITDRCELMLSLDGGGTEILSTGEVSIRPE
ncbi:MAG: biotin--[Clostridia bacterium]|nr:biotin--[acetyl-CoA-carboxylase] ligase [Clostridia bacterium]